MNRYRIVLNDGSEIDKGSISRLSGSNKIMIRIPGDDVVNAALTFSNADKTSTMICYSGVHKYTFTGYNRLYSIQNFAEENYIEMWMTGENTTHTDELTVPEIYAPYEKTQS